MTGVVIVHGSASEFIALARKTWEASFKQLVFICPWDDQYPGAMPVGYSEHHGCSAINRMMFAVLMASKFPMACVFEYDTIFLARPPEDIPPASMFVSCAFHNEDPEFSAKVYAHSPWITSGENWWKIFTCPGVNGQSGFPDRWLALACEKAGVVQCGIEQAFTWDKEWDNAKIYEAQSFMREGGLILHGVKTVENFERIFAK